MFQRMRKWFAAKPPFVGFAAIVLAAATTFGASSIVTDYWRSPTPLPKPEPLFLVSPGPSIHVPYLMEVPVIVEPVQKPRRRGRNA
jgi:hypothetical protein